MREESCYCSARPLFPLELSVFDVALTQVEKDRFVLDYGHPLGTVQVGRSHMDCSLTRGIQSRTKTAKTKKQKRAVHERQLQDFWENWDTGTQNNSSKKRADKVQKKTHFFGTLRKLWYEARICFVLALSIALFFLLCVFEVVLSLVSCFAFGSPVLKSFSTFARRLVVVSEEGSRGGVSTWSFHLA